MKRVANIQGKITRQIKSIIAYIVPYAMLYIFCLIPFVGALKEHNFSMTMKVCPFCNIYIYALML